MNKADSQKFKMITTCDTFLGDNEAKLSAVPAILQIRAKVRANVLNINELNQKSAVADSTPITKNKEKIKNQLGQKVEPISGIITSYATENKDDELLEKSKFVVSDLSHIRETNVEATIKPILTSARELLPVLADSGLSEEMVAEAEALLDAYVALIGKPRSVRNQQNTTKQTLSELIDKTVELFTNQLDKLMLQFKEKDPELYEGYLRSRIIVVTATKHREKVETEKSSK
jgi:hypothetical protein